MGVAYSILLCFYYDMFVFVRVESRQAAETTDTCSGAAWDWNISATGLWETHKGSQRRTKA